MPGPPPKAPGTARRRNATVPMRALPAAGRTGKVPAWPLPDDIELAVQRDVCEEKVEELRWRLNETDSKAASARLEAQLDTAMTKLRVAEKKLAMQRDSEVKLWTEVWATPQAVMWEELAWDREVAQYVRWKIRGEMGDLKAAQEARHWSDRLGLNPVALLRLRWEIERVEEAQEGGRTRRAAAPKRATRRGDDPRASLHAV